MAAIWAPARVLGLQPDPQQPGAWLCAATTPDGGGGARCGRPLCAGDGAAATARLLGELGGGMPDRADYGLLLQLAQACLCAAHRGRREAGVIYGWTALMSAEAGRLRADGAEQPRGEQARARHGELLLPAGPGAPPSPPDSATYPPGSPLLPPPRRMRRPVQARPAPLTLGARASASPSSSSSPPTPCAMTAFETAAWGASADAAAEELEELREQVLFLRAELARVSCDRQPVARDGRSSVFSTALFRVLSWLACMASCVAAVVGAISWRTGADADAHGKRREEGGRLGVPEQRFGARLRLRRKASVGKIV